METFVAIFTQLGVDSSLTYQFGVIVFAFIAGNVIFLKKLQEILDVREEKTVKLEGSADETLEKVSSMQAQYKTQIDAAHSNALKVVTENKNTITMKATEEYKKAEKELSTKVETARNDFANQIAANKDKYMAESEALSQSLVQKIIQ